MFNNFDIWPVLAGLGLFLFGIFMLEEALKHLAGRAFKKFLRKHTNNSIKAVFSGALFTAVLQSSSMAALLVMSFAGAGIIGLKNGIGIILGANLGTTITGWLVSVIGFKLDIGTVILPFIAFGGLGVIFLKSERWSNLSKLLMGFSLMFLGLEYMRDGISVLATQIDFARYGAAPLVLFLLIGFVLTAAIQSSSASMMIFLSALAAGLITLEQGFYLVVGADLGTTITAIIGTIKANSLRKKVGWAQFTFNLFNAVLALLLMGVYRWLIVDVIKADDPLIALVLFHSLLNLAGILLVLPFLEQFTAFIDKRFDAKSVHRSKYLAQVHPGESAAAVTALQHEVFEFLKQTLRVNQMAFVGSRTPRADFNTAYLELKTYEAEIVAFYRELLQVSLNVEEVVKTNALIACARNATLSSKSLKDVKHNLEYLEASAIDELYGLLQEVGRRQALFYSHFLELINHLPTTTAADVEQTRNNPVFRQGNEAMALQSWRTGGSEQEFNLPTLMNMVREVDNSNEALLRALQHLVATQSANGV